MNDVGSSSASAPGSAGPAQVYSAPRADDRRVRLLVVDDHPVVRSGIVGMLSGEPDLQVVGQAADGAEAIALTAELVPDVILMDLRMPGLDGVEATRRISARPDAPRVVVLTTYDTDGDILRAVEAGAIGYLLKDSPREDILAGPLRRGGSQRAEPGRDHPPRRGGAGDRARRRRLAVPGGGTGESVPT